MSLLGRKRKIDDCPNRLFLSYLKIWKDEAAAKESKAYHTYNKAYKSLVKYPLPLQSGKEALILENFGSKICDMLDSKLTKDAVSNGLTIGEYLEQSRNVPKSWWESLEKGPEKKKQKTAAKLTANTRLTTRTYIPVKSSGAYAILLTLYRNSINPNGNVFMKKAELQRAAQPLSTKSFTIPDTGSHYTAWSSMATLLKKGLVKKYNNPAKFEITDEGRALAARIEAGEHNYFCANKVSVMESNLKPGDIQTQVEFAINLENDYHIAKVSSASTKQKCLASGWHMSDSEAEDQNRPQYVDEENMKPAMRGKTFVCEENILKVKCDRKQKSLTLTNESIDLTLTSSDEDESECGSSSKRNVGNPVCSSIDAASDCHNVEVCEFELDPGKFEVLLCVDSRELSGDKRKCEFRRLLEKLNISFVERVLQIGDFVWLAQEKCFNNPGSARELVLDYVIERKCMSDLAQSIRDGRFHEQKIRLKQCGIKNVIYLAEDLNQFQHQSLPEKTLRQALINTQIVDSIFVKYSENMATTADYLAAMTNQLSKMYTHKKLTARNSALKSTNSSLININLLTFDDFNDKSMKSKGQTVTDTFIRQLMQISGMSYDKALSITTIYPTPYLLYKAYKLCNTAGERESLLSKLKFGLLNRNLGISISRSVFHLFNSWSI